jgi:hypothetical protein
LEKAPDTARRGTFYRNTFTPFLGFYSFGA